MTAASTQPTATRQQLTILLVDDEPDIRALVRIILEKDGLVVDEASGGAEALQRFAEAHPPPVPAIVLLDHRMPGLTGVEVAEQMLSINPDQLIVLFSAYIDPETEEAANAVGVTACVSKAEVQRIPAIIRELLTAA